MNGAKNGLRILEHNAEAGPSCPRRIRTPSPTRQSFDNTPTRSQDFLPSASATSKPLLQNTSLRQSVLPSERQTGEDSRDAGRPKSPRLSRVSDSSDPTGGFEPLSPIIFGEPFFGAGGSEKSAQPEMAERPAAGIGILTSGGRAIVGVPPMRSHAPWASSSKRIDAQPTSTRAMSTSSSLARQAASPELLPDRQSSLFGSIDIPVERKEDEGRCSWLGELFIGATLCQCLPICRDDPKY